MKVYKEELIGCTIVNEKRVNFPYFSQDQLKDIRAIGRSLHDWSQRNIFIHNLINLTVFILLTAVDYYLIRKLYANGMINLWVDTIVVALVHGFIMYSSVNFSMHEGAAHNAIFKGQGVISKLMSYLGTNYCRLHFADPIYYKECHLRHHKNFGTMNDGAFTNFVHPKRFFISLLPLASILDFNDYKIHSDTKFSWSKLISTFIGIGYLAFLLAPAITTHGLAICLLMIVLSSWFGFLFDRLRETTEHNLMPCDHNNGARSFGLSFWGFIVGGGPWGQPCHLMHHLYPSLPWYQQINLHYKIQDLLTEKQKGVFCPGGFIEYPLLLVKVVQINLDITGRINN